MTTAADFYDQDKAFEESVKSGPPLSWRDVGRMVNESEERLTKRIEWWGTSVKEILKDHEDRIGVEEDFTVGVKASGVTAEKFFSFGKWVLATAIAVCALAITAIINSHVLER